MVEIRTPVREVEVRYLPRPFCVLEQEAFTQSPKSTGNAKEAVAPSRLTEKIYWGVKP